MTRRMGRFHLVVIALELARIVGPSIAFSWNDHRTTLKRSKPTTISVLKTKRTCRSPVTELFRDNNKNDDIAADDEVSTNTMHTGKQQKKERHGSLKAATVKYGKVPYGEESRKYRRTVYGHSDWIEHRSSGRIYNNLNNIFFSGIVRQLKESVALVALVATSLVAWNNVAYLLHDATTLSLDLPTLILPQLPFTLSSSALGLLLVFKTNTSYGRWVRAAKTWAKIMAHCRNIVRMATAFTSKVEVISSDTTTATTSGQKYQWQALDRLTVASWLFPRALMNTLLSSDEDEQSFKEELQNMFLKSHGDEKLGIVSLLSAPNRAVAALMELTWALDCMPIDEKRRVEIDKSIVILGDCLATCERIFQQPVPLVYSRHTSRFLSLFTVALPLALYGVFEQDVFFHIRGFVTVPVAVFLSIFLFGIEELAIQLEEPFSILPMQNFCDEVRESTVVLREWPNHYQAATSTTTTSALSK